MLRIIIIASLALTLCSCGLLPAKLDRRAADYYSFQVGHLPKAKYSSFLSPAYREIADKAGLSELDTAMRKATAPSERYERIKTVQVTVQQDGHFALTTVDASLGGTFRDGKPIRWVRDGGKWFIFLGSDAEIAKYGIFPPGLALGPTEHRRPESLPPLLNKGRTSPLPALAEGEGSAEESSAPAESEGAPPAEGAAPPEAGENSPADPPAENGGEA